jgi:hypothetical protein
MSALLERKTITKMSSLLTEIAANFDAKYLAVLPRSLGR